MINSADLLLTLLIALPICCLQDRQMAQKVFNVFLKKVRCVCESYPAGAGYKALVMQPARARFRVLAEFSASELLFERKHNNGKL